MLERRIRLHLAGELEIEKFKFFTVRLGSAAHPDLETVCSNECLCKVLNKTISDQLPSSQNSPRRLLKKFTTIVRQQTLEYIVKNSFFVSAVKICNCTLHKNAVIPVGFNAKIYVKEVTITQIYNEML